MRYCLHRRPTSSEGNEALGDPLNGRAMSLRLAAGRRRVDRIDGIDSSGDSLGIETLRHVGVVHPITIGLPGEPVAPLIGTGLKKNAALKTSSSASCSRTRFSSR